MLINSSSVAKFRSNERGAAGKRARWADRALYCPLIVCLADREVDALSREGNLGNSPSAPNIGIAGYRVINVYRAQFAPTMLSTRQGKEILLEMPAILTTFFRIIKLHGIYRTIFVKIAQENSIR
jgi:hypothetical protein